MRRLRQEVIALNRAEYRLAAAPTVGERRAAIERRQTRAEAVEAAEREAAKQRREAEQLEVEARAKQERAQREAAKAEALRGAVATFEEDIRSVLDALASSASELDATAHQMAATAEETTAQATTVATASDQTSQSMQIVAASTDELDRSIAEVTGQVSQSAAAASTQVLSAAKTVGERGEILKARVEHFLGGIRRGEEEALAENAFDSVVAMAHPANDTTLSAVA
ncbi:hypothetical protein EV659_11098 [Rhodothalassium salexigens DSM 2132]|uniref:Methyl-accepting transducer domain-containing protein n=1 Tax=Rhodothalassium salexigens DSM 2132 TaxID=1188247 RepID=A0A4R2PC87_RHOSA|nr:hypothetical protein [Rhodothalassium salexigens]MBB4212351.1 chromosome segregation ATPase [Rhodothalassium salexigens DSM 2132]MBK1637775.1 hypothetical protein [Rhodothalassium salexigens DSM 2132]TCP32018.1 hypothetical protein EV659_11098 [Rhodothalassium salexigens DSM 2132]